jgi:hypothetical protein
MRYGKSGGIMKWKKCDVPWANPTIEMMVASARRLAGAAGDAADKVEIGLYGFASMTAR